MWVFSSEQGVHPMAKQTTHASSIPAIEPRNWEERLNLYPELKAKIEALLSVVENALGDIVKASEAEQRVIEEIRATRTSGITRMGNPTTSRAKRPL